VLRTTSLGDDRVRAWWGMDPRREDLPVDSGLWSAALARCYDLDGDDPDGLFGALRGMRCLGARLEETASGVRLRPGELSRTEYAELRERYLMPHAPLVERLLAGLTPQSAAGEKTA
jgi:hypothetical protein